MSFSFLFFSRKVTAREHKMYCQIEKMYINIAQQIVLYEQTEVAIRQPSPHYKPPIKMFIKLCVFLLSFASFAVVICIPNSAMLCSAHKTIDFGPSTEANKISIENCHSFYILIRIRLHTVYVTHVKL